MDTFKKFSQKQVGLGGIKCFCCFDYYGERPIFRRLARRRLKQNDPDISDGIQEWEDLKDSLR